MRRSAIYESVVTHRRFSPKDHRLRYGVYSLLLDLDEIDRLAATNPFFSRNRFNLVSFHDRDHGPRDGSDLRRWFDDHLATAGIDLGGGSVALLVFPRILGYTFNPITVWFGSDAEGRLRAVMYEVHNTFGHGHCYLAILPPEIGEGPLPTHRFAKRLHVSPFFDRDGSYAISLRVPEERYQLVIDYLDEDGDRLLTAVQHGRRIELTTQTLMRQFVRTPLLTLKVIAGIHWEALKLLRKGARYRSVPEPVAPFVDVVQVAASVDDATDEPVPRRRQLVAQSR